MTPSVVAWDFDGVLNRNIVGGRFIWADRFEAEFGQSRDIFEAMMFGPAFGSVVTGKTGLRDHVARWADHVGYRGGADSVLDYWFAHDAHADPELLETMARLDALGVRQVIATNNEALRAGYIEREMGFAARVERVFASGRLGVAKPDVAFFETVREELDVPASEILFVDDDLPNVEAARTAGWSAFQFNDETRAGLAAVLPLGHRQR